MLHSLRSAEQINIRHITSQVQQEQRVYFSLRHAMSKMFGRLYHFYSAMANRILFTGFQVPELKKCLQDHSILVV